MSPWKAAVLLIVLTAIPVASTAPEKPKEPGEGVRLEAALKHALANPGERSGIRIEASGHLGPDLHFLTLYGRGVGFWNRERQFQLDSSQVEQAIRIVLKHHLCRLPENIGGEEEEPVIEERPGPPHKRGGNPRFLVRILTITVDGLSKTITQEGATPEGIPLEHGLAELASLCRKPAEQGIGAHSLKEGLSLLAQGKLAPEALILSVNAPQLRSLKDNTDQGWILRIEHGRVLAQSHTLGAGYVTITDRPMDAREARELAKQLLAAGITTLPGQVNTPGYLHIQLRVLSDTTQVMARTYSRKPTPQAAKAAQTFSSIRNLLRSVWERETGERETPKH